MDGVSGGRTNASEVRNESSADGSVSEVALHHAELALCCLFPLIKLNLLALYRLEFAVMCSVPINISNNTGIFEVYDGIVDEELGGGRGVKNVEVVVFDPRAIEIGRRVCACMRGDRVLGFALLASPYEVSVDPNLSESDVSCNFILSILVEENKRVLS